MGHVGKLGVRRRRIFFQGWRHCQGGEMQSFILSVLFLLLQNLHERK